MNVTGNKEIKTMDRFNSIGGTDVGAILGISPYKTAFELYLEKIEKKSPDISHKEEVIWGNLLEEVIANRYAALTGRELYATGTLYHTKFPFLRASPDRLIFGESISGLEIKTVGYRSAHLWGESGSLLIPKIYYTQIAHYMMVCNHPGWHLVALIGGQELRTYTFERDKEFEELMLETVLNFWHNHVEKRIPPPIDLTDKRAKELLKKKYNLVAEEKVILGEEILEINKKLLAYKKMIKDLEIEAGNCEAKVLEALGNCGIGEFRDGSCYLRKLIKCKEYTVKEREYVRLDFKENKEK